MLSRGTWLQSQNDVYLSICLFGKLQKTTRTSSVFPLTFYEKLRFEKVLKLNINTDVCKIFSKILLTALVLKTLMTCYSLVDGLWLLENYFNLLGADKLKRSAIADVMMGCTWIVSIFCIDSMFMSTIERFGVRWCKASILCSKPVWLVFKYRVWHFKMFIFWIWIMQIGH